MIRYILIILLSSFSFFNYYFFLSEASAENFNWVELHNRVYESPDIAPPASTDTYSASSAYMLAVNFLTLRLDDKAEKWFKITADLTGNGTEARWGIAEIYRRRRFFSESIDILEAVISERPDFAPALVTRAYIYFEKGNYPKAIQTARQVISMGADIDRANLIRAHLIAGGAMGSEAMESSIFRKISRGLAARRHIRQAEKLDPLYPGLLLARGSYYLMAPGLAGGDISRAKEYLYRALEKDPGFADVYATLAKLYFQKGDMESYEKYAARARSLDPGNRIIKEINIMKEERDE